MSSDKDKSSVNVALLEKDEEFKEFPMDKWAENCEDDVNITVVISRNYLPNKIFWSN